MGVMSSLLMRLRGLVSQAAVRSDRRVSARALEEDDDREEEEEEGGSFEVSAAQTTSQ